jgi:hypothetical protein
MRTVQAITVKQALFLATLALAWTLAMPAWRSQVLAADTLPARLSDQEFWKLVSDMSEPNGSFRSDNLVSNELQFQYIIPELLRTARTGRVYLGVGPEQNFTYIAALKPAMAFVIDVRRGNRDLHLLYKSLFELSADRAEFVSLLFSRPHPRGLSPASTADEIFSAYDGGDTNWRLSVETMSAVETSCSRSTTSLSRRRSSAESSTCSTPSRCLALASSTRLLDSMAAQSSRRMPR